MIFSALLLASLSLGLGGTASDGLGEQTVAPDLHARLAPTDPWWVVEGYYSPSDKIAGPEQRGGWLAGVSADFTGDAHALLGLRYQHRVGPGWTKDRLWARGGMHWAEGPLHAEGTLSAALSSRDRESSLEGRLWIDVAPHLALEIASRLVLFDQGAYEPNRRVGSLASLRIWYSPFSRR